MNPGVESPTRMVRDRTLGVWLIGARGAVATTTIVGAAALRRHLIPPTGLVSAHEPFEVLPLAPVELVVFGGHDVGTTPLIESARALQRERGPLTPELVNAVEEDLAATEERLRPAPRRNGHPRRFVELVRRDLESFRRAEGVSRVVVINVATTEPPTPPHPAHQSLAELEQALDGEVPFLPDSTLYAYAAIGAGCPYINFTPSLGASVPALAELARNKSVPYAGRDGKTGETLLKSVLAPMFAMRRLRVKSWTGFNVLGNNDGAALANPAVAAAKVQTKSDVVRATLGEDVHNLVRIDYVPPLGDWKTAWDLVTFDGFLNTPMTLQLTWQGSDSALAAPLVLDLVRFVDLAAARGESGALGWLAFYFKSPEGAPAHELRDQYQLLLKHLCA
jgi:myo-inositol-1-phosphate synthase